MCSSDLWDYLLTLPSEVERFWKDTRFTWIRAIFFTLRYSALTSYIPYAVQVFHPRQVDHVRNFISDSVAVDLTPRHLLQTVVSPISCSNVVGG